MFNYLVKLTPIILLKS